MSCNIIFNGVEYTREGFEQFLSSSTISSKSSPATLSRVKTFLERIGVTITSGEFGGVNGVADILNNLIQITEGKEDVALTEEAMHFAVEILEQTNPKLFNSLLNKIGKYNLYDSVREEYGKNPAYQNEDGSPNIRKIKKEAIGKVLAEYVILENEGVTEKPEMIGQVKNWWDAIVSFFKNLFSKAEFNPFQEVASSIVNDTFEGNTSNLNSQETFFQLSPAQQTIVDNLKRTSQEITKIVTDKTEDQDARNEYRVNATDEVVANRVSSLSKDSYDKTFGANKQKDQEQSPLSIWASTTGTNGHGEVEDIIARWVDEEGKLRTTSLPSPQNTRLGNREIYNHIETKVLEILREYPEGTIFLTEQVVYDAEYTPKQKNGKKGIAGTVDLIAIKPDGETDILDWKFQVSLLEKGTNLIKVSKYAIQIGEYKRILAKNYGVKSFGRLRVIPGSINFIKKDGVYSLYDLTLGGGTIKADTPQPLLPVPTREELTGVQEIDALLSQLYNLYETVTEIKRNNKNRVYLQNKSEVIFKAIQDLQVKQSFERFTELTNVQIAEYRKQLADFSTMADTLSEAEKGEISSRFTDALEVIPIYANVKTIFRNFEMSEDQRKALNTSSLEMENLLADMQEAARQFVAQQVVAARGVEGDVLEAEKANKSFFTNFNPLSKQGLISLNTLREMNNEVTNLSHRETLDMMRKLQVHSKALQEWGEGKKRFEYMNLIQKKDGRGKNSHVLIDEFDSSFYTTLDEKIGVEDIAWIKDNVDVEKFKAALLLDKERRLDYINNGAYFGTEEEIEDRKMVEREAVRTETNVKNKEAWLKNRNILKQFPLAKWNSSEYKILSSPENAPVLSFYNFIREINEMATEVGYIGKYQERNFLPFIQASIAQKFAQGNYNFNILSNLMDSLTLDENTVGYGSYNKITNKLEDVIPRYFRNGGEERNGKNGETYIDYSDYSDDGIVNSMIFAKSVIEYKYKLEREEQAKLLLYIEKQKKALPVDRFGNVRQGEDKIGNEINSALVEKYIKNTLYGQKYTDQEDVAFGNPAKALNKAITWANKKTGLSISTLPERYEDNKYSLARILDFANRAFSLKTLGLNVGTSLSQYLGGNFQALINSGEWMSKTDFFQAELSMLSRSIMFKKDEIQLAAILEFMPVQAEFQKTILGLSGSGLSKIDLADAVMVMMRKADLTVQYSSFAALLKNAIVIDGQVINARKYLRSTPEYKEAYSNGQMSEFESKFDEKVEALIKEYGLTQQLSVNEDGSLAYPEGMNMASLDAYKNVIRALGSRAAGGILPGNEMPIRMTVLGNSFMVFKNWIPGLVSQRVQGFKFDQDLKNIEWGRYRTFGAYTSLNVVKSIREIYNSIKATPVGIEKMTALFEAKKADYLKKNGKELNISKEEFFDLVRKNLKSQVTELLILLSLLAMIWAVSSIPPDDENKEAKGYYNYSLRTLDKIKDEIAFFYNPLSFQSILSGNLFPALGVLTDAEKFIQHSIQEMYGYVIDDDKLIESSHPAKYLMRAFPITKELVTYMSVFSPEFAKSMNVNINPNYGMIR